MKTLTLTPIEVAYLDEVLNNYANQSKEELSLANQIMTKLDPPNETFAPVICGICGVVVDEEEATLTLDNPTNYTCETCWIEA